MVSIRLLALAAICAAGAASPALASPCEGKAPVVGSKISGTVLHVVDGERLCLASGPTPDLWTQVRIASSPAPASQDARLSKAALMNATFAKKMSCVVVSSRSGEAEARCSVDRHPVSDLLTHGDPQEVAAWMGDKGVTTLASAD